MSINRLAILASENSWYFRQLQTSAEQTGWNVVRVGFPDLTISYGSIASEPPDSALNADFEAAIVRTMPIGSLEQVIFRMDVLRSWENDGINVVNSPVCLETSIDKLLTLNSFRQFQIPFPETHACQTATQALDAFDVLGQDIVIKPIFGGEGRGLMRVCEPEIAYRVFKTLENCRSVIYCQRFIQEAIKDVRILFVGEKHFEVLRSNATSWMSNASQGGTAEPYVAGNEELDLAWKAAKAVQGKIVGVDLLQDQAGRWFVLEVNAVPGWQQLQSVTEACIADEIIFSLT